MRCKADAQIEAGQVVPTRKGAASPTAAAGSPLPALEPAGPELRLGSVSQTRVVCGRTGRAVPAQLERGVRPWSVGQSIIALS